MLKLFYITNDPCVAKIAQDNGVDRIFIDMEYIGKDERQKGLNTVKNHHTISDIKNIRNILDKSELLVRINPIHNESKNEIDEAINAGADYLMLPMWKSYEEVNTFIDYVAKRCKTILLLETDDAVRCLDKVLDLYENIDEIFIGLNDLSISQGKSFLFQPVVDGTVDSIANKIKEKNIPFGFGGVGRVGVANLFPAENVLCEHYRIGSSMVIISRAFCDPKSNVEDIKNVFNENLKQNKEYERFLEKQSADYFKKIHEQNIEIISKIIK